MGLPQLGQNLLDAGTSALQLGHLRLPIGFPQLGQNFEPPGTLDPHLGHLLSGSKRWPHSEQNLLVDGFMVPH